MFTCGVSDVTAQDKNREQANWGSALRKRWRGGDHRSLQVSTAHLKPQETFSAGSFHPEPKQFSEFLGTVVTGLKPWDCPSLLEIFFGTKMVLEV